MIEFKDFKTKEVVKKIELRNCAVPGLHECIVFSEQKGVVIDVIYHLDSEEHKLYSKIEIFIEFFSEK